MKPPLYVDSTLPDPEIGPELKPSDLKPGQVVWTNAIHRPRDFFSVRVGGVDQHAVLFLTDEERARGIGGMVLRRSGDVLQDDLNHRIRIYEYRGPDQDKL